jgi:hypothetical protein
MTRPVPTIIFAFDHGRFEPVRLALFPPFQNSGEDVVTIFKNIRRNSQVLSRHTLDRIAPSFEAGFDVLYYCCRQPVCNLIWCSHGRYY